MFGYSKKLVRNGKEFRRRLPGNLSIENQEHFNINLTYKCPDLFFYFFENVFFLPDSTLFLFRIWPLTFSFPYYKTRMHLHSVKGIIDIQLSWRSMKIERQSKPYVIIHDQWTVNYYHWMTQALPRLLLVLKTQASFTLLLPEDHCTEFHIKTLKMMGVENWESFSVDRTYYNVRNLIYPPHDIQIGDYHDEVIIELSAALKKNLEREAKKSYVFVHRVSKKERRIINEEQVLATFLFWGFSIVTFENLSFEEQRSIAGNASILAGVHGAGLSNMLFMENGSKVLELTSLLAGEQYYYYTLSNALGHDYYYQLCKSQQRGKSVQEANLEVDITLLHKNLELMTKLLHG